MPEDMEPLYQQRLARYVTAMQNEKPDMVPVRPFAAEFAAKYAGYTNQEVTHDIHTAFEAVLKCAADFDWDATVGNMVYVWTGLVDSVGLNYYRIPGIDAAPDAAFQYVEPPDEETAFMKADEYDEFIADPTGFIANVWMPRVNNWIAEPGQPVTYRHNLAWLKGGLGMLHYFTAFGEQVSRLREETGTVHALAGCLKMPFDLLADKFRGYRGLCADIHRRPAQVRAACEALRPHMTFNALAGADPAKQVPIAVWLHRGCAPFFSLKAFEEFYWPTARQIVEDIWDNGNGHQIIFYAEGDWNPNLGFVRELPERSIIYHVDRADIFEVHEAVGHKFCISGGVPNDLLAYGTPDEVRAHCKRVIETVGKDGGYIMDAGAIMQDDSKVENVQAMTDAAREYGRY